ncbi:MAG: C25 family cysteine peptidase, partial [Anaerolineae bacterium]
RHALLTDGSAVVANAPTLTEEAVAGVEAGPWAPPEPGWRVKVREDGLYEITYAELLAAGLPVDTSLPTSTFQLFTLGSEVAIHVRDVDGDGVFDTEDSLLFFGQAVASKYTADNVYWLTHGQGPGLRMTSRDGTPGDDTTPVYYAAQREMEGNAYYVQKAPGDDGLERWFWNFIYTNNPDHQSWSHTFSLAAPYSGDDAATLTVVLLGYLENTISPDHHVIISLNGTQLADVWWDGITWQTVEMSIPQGLLVAGTNTLQINCPNDTGVGYDLLYIDRAELDFANTFVAEGDVLPFRYAETGTWKFAVGGFARDEVVIGYDVTDPSAVVRIDGIEVVKGQNEYVAQFQDEVSTPTDYWVMADTTYRTVQAIEQDTPSNLRSLANGADHIIITHKDFWAEVEPLRTLRASQGRAMMVDVQDVYDEFGYGLGEPAAIHDFLAYAYGNWEAPAPSFVVLVGDGHYDPKNYAYTRVSYIHPYLAAADPWLVETAADNRYVTLVGGDLLPDMMLGRLAVNSAAQAQALVGKIVAYEQSPVPGDWTEQVLAVADNTDSGGNFAAMSDDLLSCCLPADYQAEKVYYLVTHATVSDTRTAILGGINAGKLIVNYIGHGAHNLWASEGLFMATDVDGLTNGGKLPVVLPMTCYDGFYHYPHLPEYNRDALAEVVTRADGKGAVASWSPTGLGVATGHDYLNRGFYEALFYDGVQTVGEATAAGKFALWTSGTTQELLDTYLLFGDPGTVVPRSATGLSADLQVGKTPSPTEPVTPGDMLEYTVTFTNHGPDTATGVVLTDSMPSQLVDPEVVDASPGVTLRAGTSFVWDVPDLAVGSSGWVTVRGTVDPGIALPDTIANTATIAAAQVDPMPENNSASVNTEVVAVEPTKHKCFLPLVVSAFEGSLP